MAADTSKFYLTSDGAQLAIDLVVPFSVGKFPIKGFWENIFKESSGQILKQFNTFVYEDRKKGDAGE